MKLKKIGKYKSNDSYLNAIYRANSEQIDKELGGTLAGPKRTFKQWVKEELNITNTKQLNKLGKRVVQKAVKRIAHSTIFTSRAQIAEENFFSGIKKNKEFYKQFREKTKDKKGRFTKIDPYKFKYKKSTDTYTDYEYNGITIRMYKSPDGDDSGATYEII